MEHLPYGRMMTDRGARAGGNKGNLPIVGGTPDFIIPAREARSADGFLEDPVNARNRAISTWSRLARLSKFTGEVLS